MTQMSLKQGLRSWGDKAKDAVRKEVSQMHEKHVFKPVKFQLLTRQEKLAALRSIIFLKQKRCGRIKARWCADGRPQRKLYEKTSASSPTVKTESVLLTATIDAAEERDVAVVDIPGAFLNAYLKETVHMRLEGVLAEILVELYPEVYAKFAFRNKEGVLVIYVLLTRALYGCLKSSLRWYQQLSKVLKDEGFDENPYDCCVVNKMIEGSQCTICWHVDDLKISHKNPKVVDGVINMLESIYGPVSVERGTKHTYLGMDLHFTKEKEVKVSMVHYLEEVVEEFPEDLAFKRAKTPAASHLFEVNESAEKLPKEKADIFHHVVAKLLWASMRARPDILLAISFLTSRVKAPDVDDWGKLVRLMVYIKGTLELVLTLCAELMRVPKWWIDASFGTRLMMYSQSGGCGTLGKGMVSSFSKRQKLVTKSSTEAELVGVDDVLPQVLWTRNFLIEQGWGVEPSLIFQDNQSAILLEKNGAQSSTRRTKHLDVRYYFIQDRIVNRNVEVKFCPTDEMWADYFTKPLQGRKFLQIRRIIMNENGGRSVLGNEEETLKNNESSTSKDSMVRNKPIEAERRQDPPGKV